MPGLKIRDVCAACVASFGSNLVHAACVTVALRMPRVRDAARCCVRKLVVAHTSSIIPGLGRGDGWCFEARNKKVASSIVGQLTEQEMEAVINGGSLPDTISIQAEIDKYMAPNQECINLVD